MKMGGASKVGPQGYEVQKSLLELLNLEESLVKQLNSANHALVVASKASTRVGEYKKDIQLITSKLNNVRKDIQVYFIDILGVQINGIIKEDKPTTGQAYVKREQMIESLYK